MDRLKEIQDQIADLGTKELATLADWLDDFRHRAWDDQLEADLQAGRLERLLNEARSDIVAGRTQPL